MTDTHIATAFLNILRETLTADEWRQMCAANATETNPHVCHSHDYCDANEAMAGAFARLGLDPLTEDRLWNAAWRAAWPVLTGSRETLSTGAPVPQAVSDALQTARIQLAEEQAALALCESRGFTSDARFARSEVARLQALIARLESK